MYSEMSSMESRQRKHNRREFYNYKRKRCENLNYRLTEHTLKKNWKNNISCLVMHQDSEDFLGRNISSVTNISHRRGRQRFDAPQFSQQSDFYVKREALSKLCVSFVGFFLSLSCQKIFQNVLFQPKSFLFFLYYHIFFANLH